MPAGLLAIQLLLATGFSLRATRVPYARTASDRYSLGLGLMVAGSKNRQPMDIGNVTNTPMQVMIGEPGSREKIE
jgi:hypothetical protein